MYKVKEEIEISNFSNFIGWRQRTEIANWPKFENRLSMGQEKVRKPLMRWDGGSICVWWMCWVHLIKRLGKSVGCQSHVQLVHTKWQYIVTKTKIFNWYLHLCGCVQDLEGKEWHVFGFYDTGASSSKPNCCFHRYWYRYLALFGGDDNHFVYPKQLYQWLE